MAGRIHLIVSTCTHLRAIIKFMMVHEIRWQHQQNVLCFVILRIQQLFWLVLNNIQNLILTKENSNHDQKGYPIARL
jgi:hypothetical protein